MSAHPLNPSSLAQRAELHASLFAKMFLNSKHADESASVLALYQNYEIHSDYRQAFDRTLASIDQEHSVTSYEAFRARYQQRLGDQLHQLINSDPAHFQTCSIEQIAACDAEQYTVLHQQNHQFQAPVFWRRIVLGLGHPPYRAAFIHALMLREISPYAFHQDLKRFRTQSDGAHEAIAEPGAVLNHLAERHARLYLDPLARRDAGYDKTRLIGDVYALKGDAEYWSVFEHALLESDPEFGSVYLFCFRQDIELYQAHRKELDENNPDLLAFGRLSNELISLDGDEVLQGGMAGILRTAHGHSEKGVYTGARLQAKSFGSVMASLES